MSEKVDRRKAGSSGAREWWGGDGASLYSQAGSRKYLNAAERRRLLLVAETLPRDRALFVLTLAWTGARVSEVLALTAASFQIEAGTVTIRTLKRRRLSMREIPILPALMQLLDQHFGIRPAQLDPQTARIPLWPWCRQTAWRVVKRTMLAAGITGSRASPRGVRHAFGVGTLQAGVPLNLVSRWLGHSSLASTAIYTAASGPEEAAFASRYWRLGNEAIASETWHGQVQPNA